MLPASRLVRPMVFCCLALLACPAVKAVTVSVDAAKTIRTVDDRMFGLNATVWDTLLQNSATLSYLQAADVRMLRFPGGSISDGYDWQTNRSYYAPGEDGYVAGTRTLRNWSWTNSFDNFAPIALALKAKVILTANYGSGTAEQAAAWVRYSNLTKGYGFKYWEIGNENYGSWEEDIHTAQWDPVTYATEAKAYLTAMKAVDASIKVGVVVQVGEDELDSKSPVHYVTNPRTGVQHKGWTAVMLATLKSLGATPDFVIYHRYPLAPGSETDAKLLAGVNLSGATWAQDAADLRQQVDDYLGTAGPAVQLYVTEHNDVYSDPGKQSTSLVNGLFYADSFGQLLQTEFKSNIWWALHNSSPRDSAGKQTGNFSSSIYGWRTYGDYGVLSSADDVNPTPNDPHPTYYAVKLISSFMRAGDRVVQAVSDDSLLSAYAAVRANGTLTLLVVNKSPTVTATVSFKLANYVPGSAATVYSYGIAQDEAARTATGSKDLATSSLSNAAASFTTTFSPYSMSVVVLTPPVPPTPAQPHGFSPRAGEITLSWALPDGGYGVTGYRVERATSSDFTQGLTTFDAGVATSLFDSGLSAGTTYYYRVSAANATGRSAASSAVAITTRSATPSGGTKLANISTRAFCGTDNNVTIGGFVVSGSAAKRVLVRAVGPSLTSQGLGTAELLADPTIEVHDALHDNATIATNDNWGDNSNAAELVTVGRSIGAADLLATDTTSAAKLVSLNPGVYSFVVKGKGTASGIVLLEVYDADLSDYTTTFTNIATRADCTTGNGVTIGGFVVTGGAPKSILMRAVGPTLTLQGLKSAELLQDPTIELHDAVNGNAIIATNDNWTDNANAAALTTTAARIGASPFNEEDVTSAALLITLPPGVYSFIVRGKSDTTGITLVEVYDAD